MTLPFIDKYIYMKSFMFQNDTMSANRILAHGIIEHLENGFKLPNGIPFSIYIRPKEKTDENDVIIVCKCYRDDYFQEAPVNIGGWSELAIEAIESINFDSSKYEVYWGAGCYVPGMKVIKA